MFSPLNHLLLATILISLSGALLLDEREEDEEVLIVTGGFSSQGALSSVEVVGNKTSCPSPPPLPHSRTGHVNLFNVNNDGLLLTCGGSLLGAFPAFDCLQLDQATRSWRPHSLLNEQRIHASVVQLKRGALLMGGWGTPNTSSILKDNLVPGSGRLHWQKGPDLIGQGALYSCAVSIGEDGALLVGGILEPRQMVEYRDGHWSHWPSLVQDRWGHSCAVVENTLVVVGGFSMSRLGNQGNRNIQGWSRIFRKKLSRFDRVTWTRPQ